MSEATAPSGPVGIFGGTFDPVHYGHLRSALELVERLELQQLRLMPCAVPPHRDVPTCDATHRAAMVELAVAGEPRLVCDTRELERRGTSYTIDSLVELRRELGEECSLCSGDGLRRGAGNNRLASLAGIAGLGACRCYRPPRLATARRGCGR